jgi:sterol O-acyltransferase
MPERRGHRRSSSMTDISHIVDATKDNFLNKKKQSADEIDEKFERLYKNFLSDTKKLNFSRFEVEKILIDSRSELNESKKYRHDESSSKKKKSGKLPEKIFQARNSLLTDLFKISHINTIYHVFVVIFVILLLNTFVSDFADTGKINIGLRPIKLGFRGFNYAIGIWLCMKAVILLLYPMLKLWAFITKKYFLKQGISSKMWLKLGVIMIILFESAFMFFFTKAVLYCNMGEPISMAILLEITRFLMKSYAFIRTNVPRVLYLTKIKTETSDSDFTETDSSDSIIGTPRVNDKQTFPKFSQYLYFLLVPTLIYRDEYPRNKVIRWSFVARNAVEVCSVIFLLSFISERFMEPMFRQFGSQSYEVGLKELIATVFNSMLPGLFVYLSGFYMILHSWMNGAAELLRFADRKFYCQWWNATNFSVYYRTWNIIVHDWLYLYIYKDLYENVFRSNKSICQFFVFLISAIFHEYVLAFTFRFFYPVLFIQFGGLGMVLFFATRRDLKMFGNCFMWMGLTTGMGMNFSFFYMEYYARQNCSYDRNNWVNYFTPISWSCNGLKYSKDWNIELHV